LRHIHRTTYAATTLHRFAKAIIILATNAFRVEESLKEEHMELENDDGQVTDVPNWGKYEIRLFKVGRTKIVLHEDLQVALNPARDEAMYRKGKAMSSGGRLEPQTYLLLSVRHMMICHLDSTGKFSYTKPTNFRDGITPPSTSAINILLQALPPSRPVPRTPLHDLPIEIQNHIFISGLQRPRRSC
jgi:hypothetical protein